MRAVLLLLPILLGACEDRGTSPQPSPAQTFSHDRASGEIRASIRVGEGASTEMRSGARVPAVLPPGLTIYPGATIVRTTRVEGGGARRTLVEFETPDPVAEVMQFYRSQAAGAGAKLTLDLGGEDRASLGGVMRNGGRMALAARAAGAVTRVELSTE